MTDTIEQQLLNMSLDDLRDMAAELGIMLAKRDRSRPQIVRKIRKRQIEIYAAQKTKEQIDSQTPAVIKTDKNPAFEALCGDTDLPAAEPELPTEDRGGARPGAGRPAGLTDEKARIERILRNEAADPNITWALYLSFAFAAELYGVPEAALTDDEAKTAALPVTNLLDYHCPGWLDRVPKAAQIYSSLLIVGQTIIWPKCKQIINKIKDRKDGESRKNNPGQEGIGQDSQGQQAAGEPDARPVS